MHSKHSYRHVAFALLSFIGVSIANADINRAGLVTLTDHGNGFLRSEVMLPCGQSQVWIVMRKNGAQILQQNIVTSLKPVGNGYFCIYSLRTGGFASNDVVDVRFSSTLGGTIFTPGPDASNFVSQTIGSNPIGTRPGHLNIVDLGNGSARFDLTAPSGEEYAEIFARRNSVQNVSGAVTASEKPTGNGYSRYSKTVSGYATGNVIDYRAYQFLPSSPGVFTPGPADYQWLSYNNYGSSPGEFFKTTDATYNLAAVPAGDLDVYFAHNTSNVVPAGRGWMLVRGMLPMLTVPASPLSNATLVKAYVRQCNTGAWAPLSAASGFEIFSSAETVFGNVYQYTPTGYNNQLPGQQINPAYECGGYPVTVNTVNGPVTLITGAKVQYAYVVRYN